MSNNFQLVKSTHFNGIEFDCYKNTQEQNNPQDFWATREQIGQALGYAEPRVSIANIHNRYSERLDKFSSVIKLITEAGEHKTTIYSFRGLLEICRRSNMPKADAVMDFLYDIADEFRLAGSYNAPKVNVNLERCSEEIFSNIIRLRKAMHLTQEALASLLGIHRNTIGRWENGTQKPNEELQEALAKLFNCPIDKILNTQQD